MPCTARRASQRQRRPALLAEPRALPILRLTDGTDHQCSSRPNETTAYPQATRTARTSRRQHAPPRTDRGGRGQRKRFVGQTSVDSGVPGRLASLAAAEAPVHINASLRRAAGAHLLLANLGHGGGRLEVDVVSRIDLGDAFGDSCHLGKLRAPERRWAPVLLRRLSGTLDEAAALGRRQPCDEGGVSHGIHQRTPLGVNDGVRIPRRGRRRYRRPAERAQAPRGQVAQGPDPSVSGSVKARAAQTVSDQAATSCVWPSASACAMSA
jgi:hypothetical protein